MIKEALLTSDIEGIHTTLEDVYTHALSNQASPMNKNTQLVVNYTKALERAHDMMKEQGYPLVSRVILAAHETLMRVGEGDKSDPGHFRAQSVRVGNLIPPSAPHIPNLISDLERFINSDDKQTHPLIKAGLAHVQFETIHPFLDGNGRIGRLLIVLMLLQDGLLDHPILYPSYYFKKYRYDYYQALDRVRTHGDYEGWIVYYLRSIKESAQDALKRAHTLEDLEKNILVQIEQDPMFHKTRDTARKSLQILFQKPLLNIKDLAQGIEKTYNTAQKMMDFFVACGVIEDISQSKRMRQYRFTSYLNILEKEIQ